VISEKEFTKVLIPPLRGVRGMFVLMVQTQKTPPNPPQGGNSILVNSFPEITLTIIEEENERK